jgi:hypothetical protein
VTFDDTVAALSSLVGERVEVAIYHGETQQVFAGMNGMLRRVEPHFLGQAFADDSNRPDTAFYVDGGQTGGALPFIAVYRERFVGLDADDPRVGVGWAVGQFVTTVVREDRK